MDFLTAWLLVAWLRRVRCYRPGCCNKLRHFSTNRGTCYNSDHELRKDIPQLAIAGQIMRCRLWLLCEKRYHEIARVHWCKPLLCWMFFRKHQIYLGFLIDRNEMAWVVEFIFPLQWRHNERDGVWNRWSLDCLFNRLSMRRSKKTSKFRITCLCEGNNWDR